MSLEQYSPPTAFPTTLPQVLAWPFHAPRLGAPSHPRLVHCPTPGPVVSTEPSREREGVLSRRAQPQRGLSDTSREAGKSREQGTGNRGGQGLLGGSVQLSSVCLGSQSPRVKPRICGEHLQEHLPAQRGVCFSLCSSPQLMLSLELSLLSK